LHVPKKFLNMEYSKIIAVTGMPGLYELLSSKTDGAIVRSLEDKSTKFVSSRIHNFSHLESIEVFTVRENVNLADIFHAMEKDGVKVPDGKDNAALKKYFEKVYPDLDFERVYASDLKKMVKWFDVLKANEIEIRLSQPAEEEAEAEESMPVEEVKEAKEKKDKKETKETKEPGEDKKAPGKKKAAAKKSVEVKEENKPKEVKPKKAAPKKKKDDK
jgi:Domain of unknown function (DUF6852)/Domain of unknown function (DUF5606)